MMSWHEGFAKNISRFFSRSKSVDAAGTDSEVRDAEADGSTLTCSEDPDQTPQRLLDTVTAQSSDGNSSSQAEDGARGDEGGSSLQCGSTAPPADGFLRRLGSLFQFSRVEAARDQRESSPDEDGPGLDTCAEPPPDPSQLTHTQSDEDGSEATDINAKESLEEKRRHELSCPPVVTYGTYRGLKEVRKPKKKRCVELHSPISEGDEATQPDGHEGNEMGSVAVNTDYHECASVVNQTSPAWAQHIEDALSQGVFTAEAPAVESGLPPACRLPQVAHSHWSITAKDTDPVYTRPQAEPGASKDLLYSELEPLPKNNALETVPTLPITNTDHYDSNRTPEEELEEQNTDRADDLAGDSQSEPKQAEVDSGMDEEDLRSESKTMVDNILTNALTALQKIEESEHAESGLFKGLDNGRDDGGSEAECQVGVGLSEQMTSAVLEDALVGSCSHGDCSRSLPSSGYESIAGSDTDIRGFVCVTSELSSACASVSSHNENQALPRYLAEDVDGTAPCRNSGTAEDEPLSAVHSQRDVHLHAPDVGLLSEKCMADVFTCKDSRGNKSQDTVKDNSMSNNNCGHHPDAPCGTALSGQQESLQLSQTHSDAFSHSLDSDATHSDVMSEITRQAPAVQSHESEETEVPPTGRAEREQACCASRAGTDLTVQQLETQVQHSPSQWVSVRAFRYDVAEEQNQSPEEIDMSRADTALSSVSVSGRTVLLDPLNSSSRSAAVIPQHSRFHDLDLHQVDGGFAIISEEEESDMVFVNDMGPVYSPSTRRAKAYPFSLSPIYEEESGREEALGQEVLQVPPVTEEEQRSVEQSASSILSLLQSVSEKLQSSVVGSSSGPVDSLLCDCYSQGDEDEEDEESRSILLSHQLDEANAEQSALDRIQEEPDSDGNIENSASTPFYQYLKSRLEPSGDENTKPINCHSGVLRGESRGSGKVNPRPAATLIYEGRSLSGEKREICQDVEDTRKGLFAPGATLHAVRGCWLLYEDSWYRGSCVLLEEGQTVQISAGTQQKLEESRDPSRTDAVLPVGSIRTLLKDDGAPEIHLQLGSSQSLRLCSAAELTEQQGPVCLSDLCVHTGCWVVYEQSGFSGTCAVLETSGRVTPVHRDSLVSCVKSLRPLKLAGLRVTRPLDPKVTLFEEPQFRGQCGEVLDHLRDVEGAVASLWVTGGIWVAFSTEGFRGHQCVLEEGEYGDCVQLFGGTELSIRSLRYIQTDFLEPSLCLKISNQESDVCVEMPDLQETDGFCVRSGAWVAYSERAFTGEQYVLEKGQYSGALQWGDGWSPPRSLRPIHREVCLIEEPAFLIRVYSQTRYSGESWEFYDEVPDCRAPGLASFRVIRGSWLLFSGDGFTGDQYILPEGLYPDLTSCGCISTAIKSFKPIPHSFTAPSVSVFSLSALQGLEETWLAHVENADHFFSQSARVSGGLWVAYQYAHFKGRQMLVGPGEYPDWGEHSGWETIGSMKPLPQPKGYIQLRNRALGSVLTAENLLDGSFPAKVFLRAADRLLDTQRWIFRDNLLKNMMRMGCLSVIGAKASAGAPVALWEEHGRTNQRWSFSEDGHICSHLDRSLVLELNGGRLTLGPLRAHDASQTWDVHVL